MFPKRLFRMLPVILLLAAPVFAACSPQVQPATQNAPSPTPAVTVEKGATAAPNVFVDEDAFLSALLPAIAGHAIEKLPQWMTEPFLTGGWRADASDSAPVDAVNALYANEIGADNHLEVVKGADLKTLMGDIDPLSFPRKDAGVIDAVLVSGWGKDGRDEAVLFIARKADNSLRWQGWMTIRGGFSGARLGGSQSYTNDVYGYRVFLPKNFTVEAANAGHVLVMAPGAGHPGDNRAAAFIDVEPANGRTVDAVVEAIKADLGPGFNIPPYTALGLDKSMALVVSGLPGQDVNRQLFVVYNDLLYHITFIPDTPQAGAYQQMEDLYAMIVNTFHFTK